MAKYILFLMLFTGCAVGRDIPEYKMDWAVVDSYQTYESAGEKKLAVIVYFPWNKETVVMYGYELSDTSIFPIGRKWQQMIKL
jgi:hypothetical protein